MVTCPKHTKDILLSIRDHVCAVPILCTFICYVCYLRTCTDKDTLGPFELRNTQKSNPEQQTFAKNISAPFNVTVRSSTSNIEVPIAEMEAVKSDIIDRC